VCVVGRVTGGRLRPDGGETLEVGWLPVAEALPQVPPAYQAMLRAALDSPDGAVLEPVYADPALTPHYPLLRAHVGHAPIILPGAMGLIADECGAMLMIRRADSGLWHLPGGFADLGETTTATVIRETREETGLEVEPMDVVGVYSDPEAMLQHLSNGDVVHGVGVGFDCRITGGRLHADGREATEVAFLPVDDLLAAPEMLTSDSALLLRDYQQRAGWPYVR
jgi:ADP-ribose pyrophosphatase YjhB (NUDIX family)